MEDENIFYVGKTIERYFKCIQSNGSLSSSEYNDLMSFILWYTRIPNSEKIIDSPATIDLSLIVPAFNEVCFNRYNVLTPNFGFWLVSSL